MRTRLVPAPFRRVALYGLLMLLWLHGHAVFGQDMDPAARPVPHDVGAFREDPSYQDQPYDADAQIGVYGKKSRVDTMRPAVELGRRLYDVGPYEPDSGRQFLVYGDWKTAIARNDGGAVKTDVLATQLILEFDFKLTATERIHATMRPFDKDGRFTRFIFNQENEIDPLAVEDGSQEEFDADFDAFFLEGDLGLLAAAATGRENDVNLPFAVGLIPVVIQNGIWVDDAFEGFAVTLVAMNSPSLDISNADVTFFVGFEEVDTPAFADPNASNTKIYAVAAFIEANEGFWEAGYGFVETDLQDLSYHNVTVAFSSRYGGFLSNSIRVIGNFGQEPETRDLRTADGTLTLIENSWISSSPYTFVPYLNLFFGVDRPQSLARAGGAGGILKNTGINFETDGLTGFPKLDDTGQDAYGGALGFVQLFSLNQQLVIEVAHVEPRNKLEGVAPRQAQRAFGIRYQIPLSKAWIFRTDAMAAELGDTDVSGIRFELRLKF